MGLRILLTKISRSSSVSPFFVAATTLLYFFFYKLKEMPLPPTKILSILPNPLLLEHDVISLPTLRKLRFDLDS
jgi:hypothetical protein